jgi:hypothetical protein
MHRDTVVPQSLLARGLMARLMLSYLESERKNLRNQQRFPTKTQRRILNRIAATCLLLLSFAFSIDLDRSLADDTTQRGYMPCTMPTPFFDSGRPALLFDIDQGFASGIIETKDTGTLERILNVVEMFRKKFDVYVVFNHLTANGANLRSILATTVDRRIPFLLDASRLMLLRD